MNDTHRCNRMLVLQSVPQPLCAAGVNIALMCEFLDFVLQECAPFVPRGRTQYAHLSSFFCEGSGHSGPPYSLSSVGLWWWPKHSPQPSHSGCSCLFLRM